VQLNYKSSKIIVINDLRVHFFLGQVLAGTMAGVLRDSFGEIKRAHLRYAIVCRGIL